MRCSNQEINRLPSFFALICSYLHFCMSSYDKFAKQHGCMRHAASLSDASCATYRHSLVLCGWLLWKLCWQPFEQFHETRWASQAPFVQGKCVRINVASVRELGGWLFKRTCQTLTLAHVHGRIPSALTSTKACTVSAIDFCFSSLNSSVTSLSAVVASHDRRKSATSTCRQ
jgi:hypothetical protein